MDNFSHEVRSVAQMIPETDTSKLLLREALKDSMPLVRI